MRQQDMLPEWPCPYCGREQWVLPFATRFKLRRITPVICGHCRVIFDAHWVDGCWMGRMHEAEWPGSLADFVEMKAEVLRRRS